MAPRFELSFPQGKKMKIGNIIADIGSISIHIQGDVRIKRTFHTPPETNTIYPCVMNPDALKPFIGAEITAITSDNKSEATGSGTVVLGSGRIYLAGESYTPRSEEGEKWKLGESEKSNGRE